MQYILLRYAKQPDPAVSQKLATYYVPGKKPYFTVLPNVMITMFESDENIDVIKAGLSELNIKFDLIEKQGDAPSTPTTPTVDRNAPALSRMSLPALKAALNAAVAREDFDKAAEIRDAINALQGPPTPPTTERKIITSVLEFKKHISEKKLISDVAKPKKGKMHKVLGIDADKDIQDVYTSGKKLAADLVAKVGKKKAQGMLAFVANINKEHNIYDKALTALKNIEE